MCKRIAATNIKSGKFASPFLLQDLRRSLTANKKGGGELSRQTIATHLDQDRKIEIVEATGGLWRRATFVPNIPLGNSKRRECVG